MKEEKMKNIKDFNLDELKEEFIKLGEKPFRAEQVFKWIYEQNVTSFDEIKRKIKRELFTLYI